MAGPAVFEMHFGLCQTYPCLCGANYTAVSVLSRMSFSLSVTWLISQYYPFLSVLGFPYEKVRERTLYLQVLDYDRFSRNDPIGEVSIPLNKVELGQIKTFWKELKPCSDGSVRGGGQAVRLNDDKPSVFLQMLSLQFD